MTVSLPATLTDRIGAGPASFAVCLWPQIMASAREQLIPWIDENAPELAASSRLAFQDLDIVADELRHVVRNSWRRLRVVLIGQVVQFFTTGGGEWGIRIVTQLRNPAPEGAPVIELTTEEGLRWESLPGEIRALGVDELLNIPLNIVQIWEELLSDAT